MTIEQRLTNLENLVASLVRREDNTKFYTDASIESHNVRITETSEEMHAEDSALEDAVCELSESTDTSIAALEQALCDLSEEIGGQ